jgi:hypothetical protein
VNIHGEGVKRVEVKDLSCLVEIRAENARSREEAVSPLVMHQEKRLLE